MPYCTSCGTEITDEMLFCPQCGNKLIVPKAGFNREKIRDSTVEVEEGEPENVPERRMRRGKLYKQWVTYSGLPSDEIRSTKTSRDMPVTRERTRRSFDLMSILLGVVIGILCMTLVFFLTSYF